MAECVYCGMETDLHINETPICVRCSNELEAGSQPAFRVQPPRPKWDDKPS